MSSPISLIQMPKIPMEHILEYLDFPSILVLRKVCHDLRNFIDDTKPASGLTKIFIGMHEESISFKLCLPRPHFWLCIDYMKTREGCLVECRKDGKVKEKTLEDDDFVTVFCKDFDIVLKHQKTVLEEFRIRFGPSNSTTKERVLENINKSFKSMNSPLGAESLCIKVNNDNEILTILPYIDLKPLEHIYIYEQSGRKNVALNLTEIGQLKQWKEAKELSVYGFRLPQPAQNLKHFLRIDVYLREVSAKMFLCSSTLSSMSIVFYGKLSQNIFNKKLIESFGQHFLDMNQDRNSFFRIPDTNKFLRIKLRYPCILFNRIEQSDAPQNTMILN